MVALRRPYDDYERLLTRLTCVCVCVQQVPVQHEGGLAVQVRPEVRVRGRGTVIHVPVSGQPGTVRAVRHRGLPGRVPGARL